MPVSRRTGRRYAAGSHATLGDYPRVCAAGDRCLFGGRVVVSGDHALWFKTADPYSGQRRSWHVACRQKLLGS